MELFGKDSRVIGVSSGQSGVPVVVGVREKGVTTSYTSVNRYESVLAKQSITNLVFIS